MEDPTLAPIFELVRNVDDLHYKRFEIEEHPDDETRHERLRKAMAENAQTLEKIAALLKTAGPLGDRTIQGKTLLSWAVTRNNVPLVDLLLAHGAVMTRLDGDEAVMHRAAEFGADEVVQHFIQLGLDPRATARGGVTALAAARASAHSKRVPRLLIEHLKASKSERGPVPKKLKDLAETRVMQYLDTEARTRLSNDDWECLRDRVEGIYVEHHSVSVRDFVADIEDLAGRRPELVFTCIDLIRQVATVEPRAKRLAKLPSGSVVHVGDLEIAGKARIKSLLVTGSLTVHGDAANYQGGSLFVGGDFICESVYTEGPVIIGGSLRANKVHAYGNDHGLDVRGAIDTDLLLVQGYHQVKAGRIDAREHRVE